MLLSSRPDIEHGDTKIYFMNDYMMIRYKGYDAGDYYIFRQVKIDDIIFIKHDTDNIIRLYVNDPKNNYYINIPSGLNKSMLLMDEIMERIMLYRMNKQKEVGSNSTFHLKQISDNMAKLVDNVSFSVGSEEYNHSKNDFENNIK